jgi:hypothetical protein
MFCSGSRDVDSVAVGRIEILAIDGTEHLDLR